MKFIFEVKIKKRHTRKQYLDAWKNGSAIIQKSAGAQGTTIYQNMSNPNTLLAIATWKSKKERDVAMKKLHRTDPQITEHRKHADITIIGNFEEIAAVNPKKNKY